MKESGPLDPNQTQEWIARERERLRGERGQSGQQDHAWINSLRDWLKLLRPQLPPSFGGSSEDELSQTLRGLGAAQQGIMDLLSKMPALGITGAYFEPWTQLQAADDDFRKVERQFREALVDVHLKALDELELKLGLAQARRQPSANFTIYGSTAAKRYSRRLHTAVSLLDSKGR